MPLQKNGPARASLFLILIGLVGLAAVVWGFTDAIPALAPFMNVIILAILGAAFILAITGLAIAITRPTKKGASVFALVISFALLIGVTLLFGLHLVAV